MRYPVYFICKTTSFFTDFRRCPFFIMRQVTKKAKLVQEYIKLLFEKSSARSASLNSITASCIILLSFLL